MRIHSEIHKQPEFASMHEDRSRQPLNPPEQAASAFAVTSLGSQVNSAYSAFADGLAAAPSLDGALSRSSVRLMYVLLHFANSKNLLMLPFLKG
jgi:hypothetical protein